MMGKQRDVGARILIVDDDEAVRGVLQRILEMSGYHAAVASDGGEGLAVLKAQPVDVVLLDLYLPDMPGLEVLKRIRSSHPKVAVLMITGYASVESAVEAMHLGAQDYVAKPCNAKELRLRIARVLEKVRLEGELRRSEEVFQALNQAALSVQKARALDEAFRYIGQQVRAMGMECILYQRSRSCPDELRIRTLSFPKEQIRKLEEVLGTEIGALRVRYRGHTLLTETLVHGRAQWHRLEEDVLQVLFPSAKREALDQIRTILGGSALVHAPLRANGEICGVLVMMGDLLTERDVPAVAAFAHQLSVFLENIRWMEAISQSERALKELSSRLMTVQEEERRRISRDLHDSVEQALSAIKLDLELLRNSTDGHVKAGLEENLEFLGLIMNELRGISTDLRPPILDDLGLISALRWYTQVYTERCADSRFSTDLEELDLGKEEEIAVFRIVQEALSNAVRHGRANQIAVRVEEVGDAVQVVVQDDGVGFGVERTLDGLWHGEGMGLISMRERARLLNAELRMESEPGRGTTVVLTVPIKTKGGGDAYDPRTAGGRSYAVPGGGAEAVR